MSFRLCYGSPHTCQSEVPVTLNLEAFSLAPKAYLIPGFLSAFEADHLISLGREKVKTSTIGDDQNPLESDTRTSRNAWISRGTSPIVETLYRRAGHAMNIDHKLLTRDRCAEEIQLVHYVNGQKYDSHHDWGVEGYSESRYITMLMYLTDQQDPDAGGETAFPKAGTGGGIKVVPVKGDAVLFYNLLEDGNGDDLALHGALPVWHGEKWLANFWVWDPVMHE
jgi:prolyl 4-hydroxylase